MSLEESEKLDWIKKIHANTFHLVKKSLKSVLENTEIALLILKKRTNKEKKKKLTQAKYILRSASVGRREM